MEIVLTRLSAGPARWPGVLYGRPGVAVAPQAARAGAGGAAGPLQRHPRAAGRPGGAPGQTPTC